MAIKITLHKYFCELNKLLNMSSVGLITMEIGNPAFLNWNKLGFESHSKRDVILSYYFRYHIYSVAHDLSCICGLISVSVPELINPMGSNLS